MGKLETIFPTEKNYKNIPTDSSLLCIENDDYLVGNAKKDLTDIEIEVLSLFTDKINKPLINKNSEWYQILMNDAFPTDIGEYRIIQVNLIKTNPHFCTQWETEIKQISNSIHAVFKLSDERILIIEKRKTNTFSIEKIEDFFLALDMNYDCQSNLFIGSFCDYHFSFKKIFSEERRIFDFSLTQSSEAKSLTLANCALGFYSQEPVNESYLLKTLHTQWFHRGDNCSEIIEGLWKNHGNISVTAKNLSMYRSTLVYKIDKIFEETQLNLRKMDDLFLLYLLVSNFS